MDLSYIADSIFNYLNPSILTIGRGEGLNTSYHAVVVDAACDHYQVVETLYKTPALIPGPFPLDPIRPDTADSGEGVQMEYEYYTETTNVLESRYVGINWGWDGQYMYSGLSPVWYNIEGIAWTVGPRTYSILESMVTDFSISIQE